MRFRIFTISSLVLAIALTAMAILHISVIWITVTAILLIASLLLCYHAVARPLNAVQNGIYLIKSQDFGSRLRLTGQHDADNVISLFNSLMDTLKSERLKSMEQNHFLARLLEVSPMGVAICDFDGNIIETNPAYRRMATPQLQQALESLSMGQVDTLRLGTAQIYRCSRLWFMDSGFRRPFLLIEQLTDEIARAEKEIFKKIVRTIGHEVNNTLGSVSSVLETMEDIHEGEPSVTAALGSSRESCANLVAFVRGYADVVKLPEPALAPTDLAAELQRLMPTLRSMAHSGIRISSEITGPAETLNIDMMLITRVIVNIVKNAVESIGDRTDGEISLHLDRNHLRITDNGSGITPEKAGRLFTPFFSTKHPDRGLGLMLVTDILRAHHATFTLGTDPDTRLTTFAITFPR